MIRARGAPAATLALQVAAPVALLGALAAPTTDLGARARGPRVERRVAAEYPGWARGTGIGTTVEVRVLVGRDARARRVVVAPHTVERDILTRRLRASFDSAAVVCVKRWTFHPARRDGRPVAAWLSVEVAFDDAGEDPGAAAAHGRRDTLARAKR